MKIVIHTSYRYLSKKTGLKLTDLNFEYWRTHSEFREFSCIVKGKLIFLERNIEEKNLIDIYKIMDKYKLFYKIIQEGKK